MRYSYSLASIGNFVFPFGDKERHVVFMHAEDVLRDAENARNNPQDYEIPSFDDDSAWQAPHDVIILAGKKYSENLTLPALDLPHSTRLGIMGAENVFIESCPCNRIATDASGIVSVRNSRTRNLHAPHGKTITLDNMQHKITLDTPNMKEMNISNSDLRDFSGSKLERLQVWGQSNIISPEHQITHFFNDIVFSQQLDGFVAGYNLHTGNFVYFDGALPKDSFKSYMERRTFRTNAATAYKGDYNADMHARIDAFIKAAPLAKNEPGYFMPMNETASKSPSPAA